MDYNIRGARAEGSHIATKHSVGVNGVDSKSVNELFALRFVFPPSAE